MYKIKTVNRRLTPRDHQERWITLHGILLLDYDSFKNHTNTKFKNYLIRSTSNMFFYNNIKYKPSKAKEYVKGRKAMVLSLFDHLGKVGKDNFTPTDLRNFCNEYANNNVKS